jgi:carbon storage regulator CsrA
MGMLVLARKEGQFIQIGEFQVWVIGLDRGKVRLGVKAPADVLVLRGPELVNEDGTPKPYPRSDAGGDARGNARGDVDPAGTGQPAGL